MGGRPKGIKYRKECQRLGKLGCQDDQEICQGCAGLKEISVQEVNGQKVSVGMGGVDLRLRGSFEIKVPEGGGVG
jgi:hypothetical protein